LAVKRYIIWNIGFYVVSITDEEIAISDADVLIRIHIRIDSSNLVCIEIPAALWETCFESNDVSDEDLLDMVTILLRGGIVVAEEDL